MSRKPHVWVPFTVRRKSTVTIPWPVCQRCGLIKLRNERTDAAVRAGCDGDAE